MFRVNNYLKYFTSDFRISKGNLKKNLGSLLETSVVRKAFLKFNILLSSSVAVERIFWIEAIILTKEKGAKLNDTNFENI